MNILDFSRVLAGPFATQVLANLGAQVVKVELPSGDPARSIGPFLGERSLYFSSVNTGKRGVVLDPADDGDQETLANLLRWADVVVHNFRSEAAAALGLHAEHLLREHEGLVVVTISAYAAESPDARRGAYDLTIQAEAGFMAVTGEPGGAPVRSGVPISDLAAGLWAALAVTSGLLTRHTTGAGLHIEVPLLDASLPLLSYMATSTLASGDEPGPVGSGHHRLVPYRAYATTDGHVVIAVLANKFWEPLCSVLGLEALAARSDLSSVELRERRRAEVDAAVEAACAGWSTTELVEALRRRGVPASPVNTVLEALTSSYVEGRQRVAHVPTAEGGYRVVRGPFDPMATPPEPAPNLGEHTAVVRDMLDTDRPQANSDRGTGSDGPGRSGGTTQL